MTGFLSIYGRAILSQPEAVVITPFKRMDGEPVFDEPWQAQLLAMVDALVSGGVISATQWSESLGRALQDARSRGDADNIETCYSAALLALERLLDDAGNVLASEVSGRRDAWEQAYLDTAHGQPVQLKG